jgi:hypothetical protein
MVGGASDSTNDDTRSALRSAFPKVQGYQKQGPGLDDGIEPTTQDGAAEDPGWR